MNKARLAAIRYQELGWLDRFWLWNKLTNEERVKLKLSRDELDNYLDDKGYRFADVLDVLNTNVLVEKDSKVDIETPEPKENSQFQTFLSRPDSKSTLQAFTAEELSAISWLAPKHEVRLMHQKLDDSALFDQLNRTDFPAVPEKLAAFFGSYCFTEARSKDTLEASSYE